MPKNVNKILSCFALISMVLSMPVNLKAQTAEKPNVIFIILDDLNDYVSGYNGQPQTQTPALQAFAAQGTTFTRAYCTSPQCGPSRMTMLTGKDAAYTHVYCNTDIECEDFHANFTDSAGNAEVFTLPQYLKDSAGYFTYGINKIFHCHDYFPDYDSLNPDICNRSLSWNKLIAFSGGEAHEVSLAGQEVDDGVSGLNFAPIDNAWESRMTDHICIDSAIQFLDAYTTDNTVACGKPLFMAIGLRRPHNPLFIPEKYFSPDYFNDFYKEPFNKPYNDPYNAFPYNGVVMPPQPPVIWGDFFALPENGVAQALALESGVEDKMLTVAHSYWGTLPEIEPGITDEERLHVLEQSINANAVIAYLAAIKFMDAQLQRLYDFLILHPEFLNNSIIVIASDNGYSLNEKKHWRKGSMWETDIRVPMYITDMRNPHHQVCDKVVSLVDIYPTLLDMIEITPPHFSDGTAYLDGFSLTPLLQNASASWQQPVLISYRNKPYSEGNCQPQYAVRDDRFEYIYYRSNDSVYGMDSSCNTEHYITEEEFYELGKNYSVDPNEWNNLIQNSDYAPAIQYLQQWLPDGTMYQKKAFEVRIRRTDTKCLYAQQDAVVLQADLFDTAGVLLSDVSGYTLQWSNNITADISSGNSINFALTNISEASFMAERKIIFYLHVYDAEGRNIGFDQALCFFTSGGAPNVQYDAAITNAGITLEIQNYSITGDYEKTWWDFGDGVRVYDLIPAPHTYNAAGHYTVTQYVQYGNDSSCIADFSKNLLVQNVSTAYENINVFPNPAADMLNVSLEHYESTIQVEISDVAGRVCSRERVGAKDLIQNTFSLNVASLHNGEYIIKCITGSDIYISRFVIMR